MGKRFCAFLHRVKKMANYLDNMHKQVQLDDDREDQKKGGSSFDVRARMLSSVECFQTRDSEWRIVSTSFAR